MDYKISGKFWIETKDKHFLGLGRIKLLEKIEELGSISSAAKSLKMSYKTAWDAINEINNLSDEPLVETITGGHHGGGSKLTQRGKELLKFYKNLESKFEEFMKLTDKEGYEFMHLLKSLSLHTSARNQFYGKVISIKNGTVNSEVILDINGGNEITSIITRESLKRLGVKKGDNIIAIVKASSILLSLDFAGLKISTRNKLKGTISSICKGSVNDEITVSLNGGNTITAIIPKDCTEEMGLTINLEVCALFKASDVILGVIK